MRPNALHHQACWFGALVDKKSSIQTLLLQPHLCWWTLLEVVFCLRPFLIRHKRTKGWKILATIENPRFLTYFYVKNTNVKMQKMQPQSCSIMKPNSHQTHHQTWRSQHTNNCPNLKIVAYDQLPKFEHQRTQPITPFEDRSTHPIPKLEDRGSKPITKFSQHNCPNLKTTAHNHLPKLEHQPTTKPGEPNSPNLQIGFFFCNCHSLHRHKMTCNLCTHGVTKRPNQSPEDHSSADHQAWEWLQTNHQICTSQHTNNCPNLSTEKDPTNHPIKASALCQPQSWGLQTNHQFCRSQHKQLSKLEDRGTQSNHKLEHQSAQPIIHQAPNLKSRMTNDPNSHETCVMVAGWVHRVVDCKFGQLIVSLAGQFTVGRQIPQVKTTVGRQFLVLISF